MTKVKAAIACIILVLAAAGIYFGFLKEDSLEEIAAKSRKAVVKITTDKGKTGSGFFISGDGTIMTNEHVIEGVDQIHVVLHNEVNLPAEVVRHGVQPFDIALIKVKGQKEQNYHFLKFADSDKCKNGEQVLALGYPSGKERTTWGVASNCDRTLSDVSPYLYGGSNFVKKYFSDVANTRIIQASARIDPGNSGGPLIDKKGRVLGVNTWLGRRYQGDERNHLALASNTARAIIDGAFREHEKKWERVSEVYWKLVQFWKVGFEERAVNVIRQSSRKASVEVIRAQALSVLHTHPKEYESMADWVLALALKVSSGEMTEVQAQQLLTESLKQGNTSEAILQSVNTQPQSIAAENTQSPQAKTDVKPPDAPKNVKPSEPPAVVKRNDSTTNATSREPANTIIRPEPDFSSFPPAVRALSKDIAERPSANLYVKRSQQYQSLGMTKNAYDDLSHAIRLAPGDGAILLARAMLLLENDALGSKKSRSSRAIEDLNKAARTEGFNPNLYYYRALARLNVGDEQSKVILDMKNARRYGSKEATDYLMRNAID